MIKTAAAVGCLLVLGSTSAVRADAEPGLPPKKPDQVLALGATFDLMFRKSASAFLPGGVSPRFGATLGIDTRWLFSHPYVLALEFAYRLEERSRDDVFGGEVTTAYTANEIGGGVSIRRYVNCKYDPWGSVYLRLLGGARFGALVLRDVRDSDQQRVSDSDAFGDVSLGLNLRHLGLVFELGAELNGAREFARPGGQGAISIMPAGFTPYARTGIVMRFP